MYLDWLDKVWWLSYHIKHYYQQCVDTYNTYNMFVIYKTI